MSSSFHSETSTQSDINNTVINPVLQSYRNFEKIIFLTTFRSVIRKTIIARTAEKYSKRKKQRILKLDTWTLISVESQYLLGWVFVFVELLTIETGLHLTVQSQNEQFSRLFSLHGQKGQGLCKIKKKILPWLDARFDNFTAFIILFLDISAQETLHPWHDPIFSAQAGAGESPVGN